MHAAGTKTYPGVTGRDKVMNFCKLLRIMKFTAIILLSVCLVASAGGYSQKVNFSMKNASLEKVFTLIKKQTGYSIFYNYRLLENAHPVTVHFKNASIEEALETCLQNQALSYEITDRSVVIKEKPIVSFPEKEALPPPLVITVADSLGRPLPGATITLNKQVKGVTNDKGSFNLDVKEGEVLRISYVGYETYILKISPAQVNTGVITVMLKPAVSKMEDVTVVTGYQTMDKRLTASAVTTIKGEELERKDLFSVDNMLQGKVPGLNININSGTPGAAPKVRLRGTSTLVGNREPVWVVDGIIVESPVKLEAAAINSLDDVQLLSSSIIGVNPNDIDRIDILKDASATALYGVKGGNGVIVITTKKGRFNQAPAVNYSTHFRLGMKPAYKHFDLMNSDERVQLSEEVVTRGLAYKYTPSRIGFEGAYLDYIDRKINYETFRESMVYYGSINTDWFDVLFRNSIDQSHNISVNGGGNNANYYASLSYSRQNGTAVFTNNDRYTGLLKFNSQLSRNLTAGLKLSGAFNRGEYPYTLDPFQYAFNTSRALPYQSEDKSRFYYVNVNNPGLQNEILVNRNLFAEFNVMNELEHSRRYTDVRTWDITADIQWRFLKHFTYRGVAGGATSQTRATSYADETTSYVAQQYREYYAVGAVIPEDRKQFVETPRGGEYTETNTFRNTFTLRNSIEYTRQINKHFLQLTLGNELRHNEYDVNKTFRLGYLPDRGMIFYNPDKTEYPKYYNDIAQGRYAPLTLSNKIERQVSWYGILIYSLMNRYTFNFNIRNDGSNRFGREISEQFLPTYSAAFRWMASDEKFLENIKFIDLLAVRLSYGYNGNIPETESPRLIISQPIIDNISGVDQSTVVKYANPLLRWERTQTMNAGVEFALFNNRLNGELDAYYKKGTDLIASINISMVNGINSYALNQAAVENKGFEALLKYDAIRQKNWNWSVNAAFGRNYSKVLHANYEKTAELVGIDGYLKGNTVQPGIDPNDMYSFIFTGLSSAGMPLFKELFFESYNNIRPEITEYFNNILTRSGSRIPYFDGSLGTSLRYKKFTLQSSFIVKLGYVKRLENLYKSNGMIPAPHENSSSELVKRWKNPGDEAFTNIPKLTDANVAIVHNNASNNGQTPYYVSNYLFNIYNNSDVRVVNASHVRLSSLALQYTITGVKHTRNLFSNAMIRLQGNDLVVFADKRFGGQDPETLNGTLPRLPSFSLSLDVRF